MGAKLSSRIVARAVKALLGPPPSNGRGTNRSAQTSSSPQTANGPATRVVNGSLRPASRPPSQPLVGEISLSYRPVLRPAIQQAWIGMQNATSNKKFSEVSFAGALNPYRNSEQRMQCKFKKFSKHKTRVLPMSFRMGDSKSLTDTCSIVSHSPRQSGDWPVGRCRQS